MTAAYRRALTELGADRSLLFRRGQWPTQGDDVLDEWWYRSHGWRVTNVDAEHVLVSPPTATGGDQ
jgi:hypothetical protein